MIKLRNNKVQWSKWKKKTLFTKQFYPQCKCMVIYSIKIHQIVPSTMQMHNNI
jgi:hypothetical protein